MRKTAVALVVSLIVRLGWQNANAASIEGKWVVDRVTRKGKTERLPLQVQLVMDFQKRGKVVTTFSRPGKKAVRKGTWKLEGTVLTTAFKDKTEKASVRMTKEEMTLTETRSGPKGPSVMYLKRIR